MTEARELVPREVNLIIQNLDISSQRLMGSPCLLKQSWCFMKPKVPSGLGHSSPILGYLPIQCCKCLCSVLPEVVPSQPCQNRPANTRRKRKEAANTRRQLTGWPETDWSGFS